MRLGFHGATGTVTGSKYLVQTQRANLLVDCGLFQGYKQLRLRNGSPLPFEGRALDAVVLTHAHLDHSGYLPLLIRNGHAGPIHCTEATYAADTMRVHIEETLGWTCYVPDDREQVELDASAR